MQNDEVRDVWDSVAGAWSDYRDRLEPIVREVADWLVEHAVRPGDRTLDLAGGVGAVTSVAAEVATSVVCSDFSPEMVRAASERFKELPNVETRVVDAQNIDFPADTFDSIVCRFGLMLMPEPDRALAECRRVLKDGGRLAFATWSTPDKNPWTVIPAIAISEALQLPATNPFEPAGMFSLCEAPKVKDLVLAAGFSDVTTATVATPFVMDSVDHMWDMFSRTSGRLATALKTADADTAALAESAFKGAVESVATETSRGVSLDGEALVVLAT